MSQTIVCGKRIGPTMIELVKREHPNLPACLSVDYAMRVNDERGLGAISFLGYDAGDAVARFDRAVEIMAKENAE